MKIKEYVYDDFTNDVTRFAYLRSKYFNGINGEVEAKIGWIDELIDILLLNHLITALNKTTGIKLSANNTPTSNVEQTTMQTFAMELFQNKNSFIYYLCKKIKEYILKLSLVEITFSFDYLTSNLNIASISRNNNKKLFATKFDSNITEIYCRYIDIMNGNILSFERKETRDANSDLLKELRKPKNAALKFYNLPEPILQTNPFIKEVHPEDEHYIQALSAFSEDYHSTFSFGEYASKDFVFLQWTNTDYKFWFPPNFPLYLGFLFDNFRGKKPLYWHCQDYKNKLSTHKKFDWGEKFNTIKESYERLVTSAQTGLPTYKKMEGYDSAAYICNDFLINNFLHRDFFSSLDSYLFDCLSNRCVLSALLSHKIGEGISDVTRNSIFYYELLHHLFIFDINMNHLEKTDFNIDNISGLTPIEEVSSIPLQLIYDFLHEIYMHLGSCINEVLHAYTYNSFSLEYFEVKFMKEFSSPAKVYGAAAKAYAAAKEASEENSYKNKTLLDSFSKFVSKFSTSEYTEHQLDYDISDKEQIGLRVHLLHYPACNGTLIWDRNMTKKWQSPNI